MNSLKLYLESLLDKEDDLAIDNSALLIKHIVSTYNHINKSKLKVRQVGDEYVVDYDGPLFFDQHTTTLVDNNFKWGYVFSVSVNGTDITSLEGSPEECDNFWCNHTNITSLEGAPRKCREFKCFATNITTLEGAPEECDDFDCNSCKKLTSLKGAPKKCVRFKCNNCPNLKSLKYSPRECEIFDCRKCTSLTSLDGISNKITKKLDYSGCINLKDVELPAGIKCKIKS